MGKMNLVSYVTLYIKKNNNSQYYKTNHRAKIFKPLKKPQEKIFGPWVGINKTQKAQIKGTVELNFNKIKNFAFEKTVSRKEKGSYRLFAKYLIKGLCPRK